MSNILILGGTGAMGEHLVHLLGQDSGNHIYVTSRTVHKNQANVSYHVGNAHDDVFLFPLLKMQHGCMHSFRQSRNPSQEC